MRRAGGCRPECRRRGFDRAVPLTGLLERAADGAQLRLRLQCRAGGTGGTYYAERRRSPVAGPVKPDIRGLVVERWYERFDKARPVTPSTRAISCGCRLRITAPADREFVAVEDPLPAGLEPMDLEPSTRAPLAIRHTRDGRRAKRQAIAIETVHDGKPCSTAGGTTVTGRRGNTKSSTTTSVVLLRANAVDGELHARATSPAQRPREVFTSTPRYAEEMYNPALQGRSDGGRFYILEQKP